MRGAVLREYGGAFSVEPLELPAPAPDQVLVRLVATGVCHTDEKVRQGARGVPLPVVLGHEGAGVVTAVGSDVDPSRVGEHVVLTFAFCGACDACRSGHPAYCRDMDELNFGAVATIQAAGGPAHGGFFGQSSFATHAVVAARSAIAVPDDVPLELLGPLGCSIQTGAGAVLNVLAPVPGDALAVWGTGPVGLAAVAAARWRGCETIVAIDRNAERLALATELGATHALHVSGEEPAALRSRLPAGVSHAFDTTGRPDVLEAAVAGLAVGGTLAFVGGARAGERVAVEVNVLLAGRSIRGVVQGDSDPATMIPMLARRVRDGDLPLARLVRRYPLERVDEAIADALAGRVVKPVLTMA